MVYIYVEEAIMSDWSSDASTVIARECNIVSVFRILEDAGSGT